MGLCNFGSKVDGVEVQGSAVIGHGNGALMIWIWDQDCRFQSPIKT